VLHEGEIVWEVTAGTSGRLVGDRNYWLPAVQAALRKVGIVQASSQYARKAGNRHTGGARYWAACALALIRSLDN